MKERDEVLAPLPLATGQVKNRPAIVLRTMPPYGDFLSVASAPSYGKR
jgi:mRNA interferase MazF